MRPGGHFRSDPALGVDIGPFSRSIMNNVEVAFFRSSLEGIAIPSTLGVDIGPSS